jgi:hypothetical protein
VDSLLLPLLALAAAVAVAALALATSRRRREEQAADPPESQFAVSTEGMKVCHRCGMGNLWTERTCSSCGVSLKG